MINVMYKVIWRSNARDNLKGLSCKLALKIEEKIEDYFIVKRVH